MMRDPPCHELVREGLLEVGIVEVDIVEVGIVRLADLRRPLHLNLGLRDVGRERLDALEEIIEVVAHLNEEVVLVEFIVDPASELAVVILLLGAFGDHLVDLRLDLDEGVHDVMLVGLTRNIVMLVGLTRNVVMLVRLVLSIVMLVRLVLNIVMIVLLRSHGRRHCRLRPDGLRDYPYCAAGLRVHCRRPCRPRITEAGGSASISLR